MRINFFEEYPTKENLSKLNLIGWPSTIFIAASSLDDFINIRDKYIDKYPHIVFGWWPIIPGSYWVSRLSNPADLDKIFNELTKIKHDDKLPILIDFELPIKKYLFIKNMIYFRTNSRKIENFLANSHHFNLKIYSAEYPSINRLNRKLWRLLGVSPALSSNHKKIIMCYSSMKPRFFGNLLWERVKKFEELFSVSHAGRVSLGIGTIASGVFENEPILEPQKLKEDIIWAKKCNVDEVFIFRLGGMNKAYLDNLIDC